MKKEGFYSFWISRQDSQITSIILTEIENYKKRERINGVMASETITITKEEYSRLKKCEEIDHDLLQQFVNSIKDIAAGRIKRIH